MRIYILCAAFIAASGALAAADDPEAVYAEFHRALMRDDYEATARLSTGTERRLAQAKAKPPSMKGSAALSPNYRVVGMSIIGERAVLRLSGRGGTLTPEARMAGEIILLREGAEWKVHEMTWRPLPESEVADAPPPKPLPPLTAEQMKDPEAVYWQYHRAMMAGDMATMEGLSTESNWSKVAVSMRGKNPKDMVWVVAPSYSVTGRAVSAKRTILEARGQAGPALGGGPMSGRIVLLKQGDAWKVDDTLWSPVSAQAGTPAYPSSAPAVAVPRAKPPVSAGRGRAIGGARKAEPEED